MSLARNLQRGGVHPITSPLHPDVIAYWTMDNISGSTLFDETPASVDGTITGATAVAGKLGNALNFTGGTDIVNFGDVAAADFGGDFTVVTWVRTSDTTKNKAIVDKRQTVTGIAGYFVGMGASGVVAAYASDGSVSAQATTTTTINDGAFHLVIATYDRDGNIAISLDGASPEATASMASVGSIATSADLVLGNKSPQVTTTTITDYIGDIDSTRLIKRLITAAERAEFWNGGSGA